MANNFKYTGNRVPIAAASADLVGGQIAIQGGFYGIVDHSIKSGEPGTLLRAGVFNVPVPADLDAGDALYVPYTDLETDEASVTLTATAGSNVKFGTAVTDADVNNYADVLLSHQ